MHSHELISTHSRNFEVSGCDLWATADLFGSGSATADGYGGGFAMFGGGLKQSTFCMARRKTMITMGSPDFVWINTNEIISSWYLLGAVCVTPQVRAHREQHRTLGQEPGLRRQGGQGCF
jgi:hypothetical protein